MQAAWKRKQRKQREKDRGSKIKSLCRERNKFASSVAEEPNRMKAVQQEAVANQVRLDQHSLQRLKEAEAKDKVLPMYIVGQDKSCCSFRL